MQLVLTHEQADFDALAALYAASLMEGALPILPRRTNRNTKSFLTLYGVDFPFIDPRDLPQDAIESVILVDTQSLITLKGMGKDTKVMVYDHHPHRGKLKGTHAKDYPVNWDVVTFDLGATTTYFVEVLRERGDVLTPIQATLLLLGIYEDTGSLTYSRTTSRDAHAAGWLLEQGADLRIVTSYLNPPLSLEQRDIYDQLVAAIETFDINGHRIMLACGESSTATEEISILAHKLRDLFDPDALFVLVHTLEGIRFVARSSTDQIDVSAITAHFGGGGHNRAAAALIKKPEPAGHHREYPDANQPADLLASIRAELIALLPRYIRPVITVGHLMSKRPRVLSAETPVKEAAALMARYGYEGFPVVTDGKVVGLLTRRAVDRAVSHHLNLPASSLMEAGVVQVHPADSLQRLQNVMTESGWGQVPVVDPETHKVIGIVTRTDVLKTLSHRHPGTGQSLAQKLSASMPAEQLALIRAVADEGASQHLPVYIVGGFVRDLLLDFHGQDLDMVVEGDAISLGGSLVAKFGGKLTSHARFGTARWYLDGSRFANPALPGFLDLISARQEFYEHPSALPTVEHGSIKLDLHRRDFTINTLALRLDGRHFGELHDYYGGLPDLKRRIVRVLHSLSFVDDPTRMLRAIRYEQRYGFEIESRTLQLMDEARPLIARLSGERIRHELDLILVEQKAVAMLARLEELGLLKAISEDLPWSEETFQRLGTCTGLTLPPAWDLEDSANSKRQAEALVYCLWFMDLPQAVIESLNARLAFSMSTFKAIQAAAHLNASLAGLIGGKPSQWVEMLDGIPLLAVYAVYLASGEKALELYATRWRFIHPHTDGDTLKARGLRPGPEFRSILRKLRSAWLDGQLASDTDEAAYLVELLF